jgi:hypothetical protein
MTNQESATREDWSDWFDPQDDEIEWCTGPSAEESPVPPPVAAEHRRRPYGHGIDARRTAQLRLYPMEHSPIFRHLKRTSGKVTMPLLMGVVAGVLGLMAPNRRPPPPGRSQKRAKPGLVAWLDENASLVMGYLRSHPTIT